MDSFYEIHPKLEPYIKTLAAHEFGILRAKPEIRNIQSGSIIRLTEPDWGDRFQLKIPFCGTILTWQVLMCPNNLKEPPDFIMEDNFLDDATKTLITSEVPSLLHWEPSNPKCLLQVVLELLQLYKIFQGNQIQSNPESRFHLEYNILLHNLKIPYTDFEALFHNENRVSFLIRLKIDFSKLPFPISDKINIATLYVDLRDNCKNIITLTKTKDLDDIFGGTDLPDLTSEMLLMDYISLVEKHLQSKVDETVAKLNQRKLLLSYFIQYFEPAVLNGDYLTFHNISFLLESNDLFLILLVKIPTTFPEERPNLSLISTVTHKTDIYELNDFMYDSKWDTEKIFENILIAIKRFFHEFFSLQL